MAYSGEYAYINTAQLRLYCTRYIYIHTFGDSGGSMPVLVSLFGPGEVDDVKPKEAGCEDARKQKCIEDILVTQLFAMEMNERVCELYGLGPEESTSGLFGSPTPWTVGKSIIMLSGTPLFRGNVSDVEVVTDRCGYTNDAVSNMVTSLDHATDTPTQDMICGIRFVNGYQFTIPDGVTYGFGTEYGNYTAKLHKVSKVECGYMPPVDEYYEKVVETLGEYENGIQVNRTTWFNDYYAHCYKDGSIRLPDATHARYGMTAEEVAARTVTYLYSFMSTRNLLTYITIEVPPGEWPAADLDFMNNMVAPFTLVDFLLTVLMSANGLYIPRADFEKIAKTAKFIVETEDVLSEAQEKFIMKLLRSNRKFMSVLGKHIMRTSEWTLEEALVRWFSSEYTAVMHSATPGEPTWVSFRKPETTVAPQMDSIPHTTADTHKAAAINKWYTFSKNSNPPEMFRGSYKPPKRMVNEPITDTAADTPTPDGTSWAYDPLSELLQIPDAGAKYIGMLRTREDLFRPIQEVLLFTALTLTTPGMIAKALLVAALPSGVGYAALMTALDRGTIKTVCTESLTNSSKIITPQQTTNQDMFVSAASTVLGVTVPYAFETYASILSTQGYVLTGKTIPPALMMSVGAAITALGRGLSEPAIKALIAQVRTPPKVMLESISKSVCTEETIKSDKRQLFANCFWQVFGACGIFSGTFASLYGDKKVDEKTKSGLKTRFRQASNMFVSLILAILSLRYHLLAGFSAYAVSNMHDIDSESKILSIAKKLRELINSSQGEARKLEFKIGGGEDNDGEQDTPADVVADDQQMEAFLKEVGYNF